MYRSKDTEKKIKITSEGKKSISNNSQEKTIIITIIIALIILSGLLVYLVFFTETEKEEFSAIYYLNNDGTLENFPDTVILGQNNTFKLIVGVINENGTTMDYLVKVNIDDGESVYNPSNATTTLNDGDIWESEVDIFLDSQGTNKVIFELYAHKHDEEIYDDTYIFNENDFTGNEVFFSIDAINQ
ncbi:MAG: DUF1616 domain-containing protein [Candidatus Bathyarchaeota archaeon]